LAKLTMEAWVAGFRKRPGCGEQSFSTTARYWQVPRHTVQSRRRKTVFESLYSAEKYSVSGKLPPPTRATQPTPQRYSLVLLHSGRLRWRLLRGVVCYGVTGIDRLSAQVVSAADFACLGVFNCLSTTSTWQIPAITAAADNIASNTYCL
jgi:hypothetical protein